MNIRQQIIVAVNMTDRANDVRQTVPMVDQTIASLDNVGVTENVHFPVHCKNMEAIALHQKVAPRPLQRFLARGLRTLAGGRLQLYKDEIAHQSYHDGRNAQQVTPKNQTQATGRTRHRPR